MKRIKWVLFSLLLICVLIGITFVIPKKLIDFPSDQVSKITLFSGSTGSSVDIMDAEKIGKMITNLNNVTFKKGKPSFGYMGYGMRMTIYNTSGDQIKELTINSEDRVRYNGFFYKTIENKIDYDYLIEVASGQN